MHCGLWGPERSAAGSEQEGDWEDWEKRRTRWTSDIKWHSLTFADIRCAFDSLLIRLLYVVVELLEYEILYQAELEGTADKDLDLKVQNSNCEPLTKLQKL